MLAQYTNWDTPTDAVEFFDAYSQRTEKRYKVSRPPDATGKKVVYSTGEGIVSIELRGSSDVVIIEGAQDQQQLARLSDRVWQSKKSAR